MTTMTHDGYMATIELDEDAGLVSRRGGSTRATR